MARLATTKSWPKVVQVSALHKVLNVDELMGFALERVDNIVRKGDNADYQKPFTRVHTVKSGIIW